MSKVVQLPLLVLVLLFAACGGGKTPVERGRIDYLRACSSCHGPEGQGMGKLGNRLRRNEFVRTKTDEELVGFLKVGRRPGDPDNKSGILMPPRGLDPRLSDEDLKGIVLFLRTWTPGPS
jgi:mono/diheme cytochrome c family protein